MGTLTADGSSDNTGTSAIVHRPTAHATEATWRACLVSPLAAGASATAASVCACRSGLVIERATVACWCWPGPATRFYSTFMRLATSRSGTPGGWGQARRPPGPRDQYRRRTHAHAAATGLPGTGSGSNLIHGLERSIGGR